MKLTKSEIESLKAYNCDVSNIKRPNGDVITNLVVISHGRREMHEAGYPFIKIIGFNEKNEAINLGWHDHFICSVPVNIDSFGKNIFHIMPWATGGKKKFKVREGFISCSTFEIGSMFPKDSDKFIWLR
jgi:hypothetical protein